MQYVRCDPAEYWRRYEAFCEAVDFMGLNPADRHMAWAEHTTDKDWKEWPVPFGEFLSPYYLGTDVVVRPVIRDFLGDFWNPANAYELFIFIAGIGSGKSFSASLSLTYMLYILSCMRNPQRYLSSFPGIQISGDAEIVLMNASAAGADQSRKIVYGETFEKVLNSPYFKVHFEPYGSSELVFPNRIRLSPGTSQWQSALGWNVIGFIVDEAAFGVESERADYVKELFLALNQRRRSRFNNMGFGGMFTSPGSEHGFVELSAADTWDPSVMVRRTTTWDAKDEMQEGAKVFLLDRDPDTVRILETDLHYVAPGVCQRADGEIVRYRSRSEEEILEEMGAKDVERAA